MSASLELQLLGTKLSLTGNKYGPVSITCSGRELCTFRISQAIQFFQQPIDVLKRHTNDLAYVWIDCGDRIELLGLKIAADDSGSVLSETCSSTLTLGPEIIPAKSRLLSVQVRYVLLSSILSNKLFNNRWVAHTWAPIRLLFSIFRR